jgi:hypothetical protein
VDPAAAIDVSANAVDGASTAQSAMAAKRADLDMKNLLGAIVDEPKEDEPVDGGSLRIRIA